MTEEQIINAVKQVIEHCDKVTNYRRVSVRSAMDKLGFSEVEADEVIQYCASRGFNYCIDPIILLANNTKVHSDVCYWEPEQLKSRLEWVT